MQNQPIPHHPLSSGTRSSIIINMQLISVLALLEEEPATLCRRSLTFQRVPLRWSIIVLMSGPMQAPFTIILRHLADPALLSGGLRKTPYLTRLVPQRQFR